MEKFANADASVQRDIEGRLIEEFKKAHQEEFGFAADDVIKGRKVWLNEEDNDYMLPDIYSEKYAIIGEIHTHLGSLKPAQKHKVAADILKMLTLEKACGKELKKYIIVCSEKEKEQLTKGSSHLVFTIKLYKINVEYYPISADLKNKLEEAMKKQDMYGKDN